jgi:antibiotic biosynthesis monooxygenase (ABM) superfamily enzyme
MQEPKLLGSWLDRAREKAGVFKILLYVLLAALVVLNFFIVPHEPEFAAEKLPGFWALFALIGTVVMVVVLKQIVYPMLAQPEEDNR